MFKAEFNIIMGKKYFKSGFIFIGFHKLRYYNQYKN